MGELHPALAYADMNQASKENYDAIFHDLKARYITIA